MPANLLLGGASTSHITALSTTNEVLKAGTGWLAAPAAGARTTRIDVERSTSTGLRPSWLRGGGVGVLNVVGITGAKRLRGGPGCSPLTP